MFRSCNPLCKIECGILRLFYPACVQRILFDLCICCTICFLSRRNIVTFGGEAGEVWVGCGRSKIWDGGEWGSGRKEGAAIVLFIALHPDPLLRAGSSSELTVHWGWLDGLEVRTLTSKLLSLGSNPEPAINCQPGVSQAG